MLAAHPCTSLLGMRLGGARLGQACDHVDGVRVTPFKTATRRYASALK